MADITVYEPELHNELVARNQAVIEMRDHVFQLGIHYGEPFKGAGKPTLLKPGAEAIMSRFHLWPRFTALSVVEQWDKQSPLFHYRYECQLIHRETGEIWGAGVGSCNSLEDKYGWRWVSEPDIPDHLKDAALETRGGTMSEYDFAIEKSETTGQYGKPIEHWARFAEAIRDGSARKIQKEARSGKLLDAWEIDATEYRVPNENVFTIVNTIDKMAQKRALVAAVLIASGASAYFTQDVEDFPGYAGRIVSESDDPVIVESTATPKQTATKTPPEQKTPSELDEHLGPRHDRTAKTTQDDPASRDPLYEAGKAPIDNSDDPFSYETWKWLKNWVVEQGLVNHVGHGFNTLKEFAQDLPNYNANKPWAAIQDAGWTIGDVVDKFRTHHDEKATT